MKPARPLFALLALALLAAPPHASAQGAAAAYPEDLQVLAGRWIEAAEAEGAAYADRPWYANAERFLDLAREANAAGRVRIVMYDLETYLELVHANVLHDEAMTLASDADRRTLLVERARDWADEADAEWRAFREALHAHDGQLRSVHSLERAGYAADLAVTARVSLNDFDRVAREIPRQSEFNSTLALGLAHVSVTPRHNLAWARDILGTVPQVEGLPPRVNETAWAVVARVALHPATPGSTPPSLEPFLPLKEEAIANEEGLLGFGILANELRTTRASSIYVIYGDAQGRNPDVAGDAKRNLAKRLPNSTMDTPRSFGLQGIMTADALDTAAYTLELLESRPADLGLVVSAWARLDIADVLDAYFATTSPIRPAAADVDKETPAPAVVGVVAAVALVALARRRAA